MTCRAELLQLLRCSSSNAERTRIRPLLEQLEREQGVDLAQQQAQLEGVWELRWSSSALPYLMVAPWLENLQVLAPQQGRAMNLLRLRGPLSPLGGVAVVAAISLEGPQRVAVRFQQGGWIGAGPVAGRRAWLRQVRQSFPAWLDITVLDEELRVCRGNAGTLFALLRRSDLKANDLLPSTPLEQPPAG
ncbi:MAG: PAP/fibrillin family protein [Prochlorococcaceae cyanobacterium]